MVNSRSQRLDEAFFALSDPTRRAMIDRLAEGERTVAELAEPFGLSPPAISKHLRVLERAGLLTQDRVGRSRRCRLTIESLHEMADWIAKYRAFWGGSLDRLGAFLDRRPVAETPPNSPPDSLNDSA